MDDAAAVVALRDGDLSAFGRIYDTYADRLHAYAFTLLADRDAASDAVHDAFLLAHDRIDQLRDPALLRPWLYAITRSQAQRALRARSRTAVLDAAPETRADEVRWDRSLDADEARLLVLAALAGLNDGDREVIELSLHHELDNAALSRALGRSSSYTSALVSRAKRQFDGALTAVLLMRTRGRDCDELRGLISDESTLTPLLRKRIARHAKTCDSCRGTRRAAIAILPGIALAMPFPGAPDSVREDLLSHSGSLNSTATLSDSGGHAMHWDREGFPAPSPSARRRVLAAGFVASLVLLGLMTVTGAPELEALNASDAVSARPIAEATSLASTPALPKAAATPSAAPRGTTAPTQSPTSTEDRQVGTRTNAGNATAVQPRSTPRASQRQPRATPPAPSVSSSATPVVAITWSDTDPDTCLATFSVRVTATSSGAPVSAATATWRGADGSSSGSVSLVRTTGQTWQGELLSIPSQAAAQLTVRVVTSQGVSVTTDPEPLSDTCGG